MLGTGVEDVTPGSPLSERNAGEPPVRAPTPPASGAGSPGAPEAS